jgi:DNA-binding NtrC family response regulator
MMDTPRKVLIVDDERDMLTNCTRILRRYGYECMTAETSDQGLALVHGAQPDVVLVDLRMPGKSGIDIVKAVKSHHPHIEVVLMTAYATIETAVDAIKQGAFDYLPKPFTADQLQAVIQRTLRQKPITQEARRETGAVARPDGGEMVGNSEAMAALREHIRRIAATEATVLITGESGTGKELVARSLHQLSRRRALPFVPVDCAALPESLLESELFGHEKGAFTGASLSRPGLFELAHRGTLFLDEVAELPLPLQAKLLRVLEARQLRRLGGRQLISIDVRLIAATNRDLAKAMEGGTFREDLFYRLNVVRLKLPPLRDRREEIPPLVHHYLRRFGDEHRKGRLTLGDETLEYLLLYSWPGNVRQLANEVRRMVALAEPDSTITPALLSRDIQASRRTIPAHDPADEEVRLRLDQPLPVAVEMLEQLMVRRALDRTRGRVEEASRLLGISRKGLFLKRRRWGLGHAS